ncbi:MAG: rhodanese-like domain-containing protein, partial [Anaerolineales bacterium]
MKSTSLRKVINIRTTAFLILLILGSVIAACAPSADVASPEVVSGLIDAQTYNQRFVDGEDHLLIDVRTPEEFASGHIPGAINISVQSLPDRLDEVPNDET